MKLFKIEVPGFQPKHRSERNAALEAQRHAEHYQVAVTVTAPDKSIKTYTPSVQK